MSIITPEDSNYILVAAIDFGTTFSGYAFSFKNDKSAIFMNKNWGASHGHLSYKTPTSVLTDANGEFVAFGYDAEEIYSQEYDDEDDDDVKPEYHLYKHFKMSLHNVEKLTRAMTINSTNGRAAPALDIFTMALKYLKDHLLNTVGNIASRIDESLIKWVLTVPAIWREEAKQFMREAAFKAGLIPNKDSRKLHICLEPEGASILCRNTKVNTFIEDTVNMDEKFSTGTTYLVVDAGGGTVDITVHEILITGNVKELHRANGGPWGGSQVDENFVKLLETILGIDFVHQFKKKYPSRWFEFIISFEKKKRSVVPGVSKVSLNIPLSMVEMYNTTTGKGIDTAIKSHSKLGVGFSQGLIILKPKAVDTLYEPVIQKIVSHLEELLESSKVRDCGYMFLVGGFGQSEYLQDAVKKVCEGNIRVLVPSDAQLAVMKGAVLFGHTPESIESRVVMKTYGTGGKLKCREGEHDEKYTFRDKLGQLRCHVFRAFVMKDEEVKVGSERTKSANPIYPDQTTITKSIYHTDKADAKYCKEEGVVKLGCIRIEMPNVEKGLDREIETKFVFGGTEIEVHATDVTSGNTAKTVIDFL